MPEYIKLSDVLSLLGDNHDEDDGAFVSVEDVLCLPTKNWDQGWIALTEEMPAFDTPVIVSWRYDPMRPPKVVQGTLGRDGWWMVPNENTRCIEAWMPMPDPPEKEERESDIRETLTKMFDDKFVLDFERALADALANYNCRLRREIMNYVR